MRRAAAIDANQPEIVAALRAAGVTVQPLHAVGGGCPDLLVSHSRCGNLCLEVKDGSRPPSERRLTPAQVRWHRVWRGPVRVVTSAEEALAAVFGSEARL